MTATGVAARSQPLPDDVRWGGGRFSTDGETLLVEPAGLSDRVLVVNPGRADSARALRLEGDLPSDQVRTDLLGWVGADKVLAAVHQATGSGTWQADADLALLTLTSTPARGPRGGRTRERGRHRQRFHFATDLLAVDLPGAESGKSVVDEPGPARDSDGSPTPDPTTISDHPWLTLGAVGLAVGAALSVMSLRRKRT